MKRIFKKEDGGVVISHYKKDISVVKFPDFTNGLEYIDVQDDDHPPSDSNTGDYHEMIHFDGECIKENLKQDKEWNVVLMPDFLIKQKRIEDHNSKLDEELVKDSPDPVAVVKLQRNIDKCKLENDPLIIKQWAVEGLDQRVADGKQDKDVVRVKLLAKIEELKGAKDE